MKWILIVSCVVCYTCLCFGFALQPIHVVDPNEDATQPPPAPQFPMVHHNATLPNTTFFLSVIPVQEPIKDDTPPPGAASSDSSVTTTSEGGRITPPTPPSSYDDVEEIERQRERDEEEEAQRTAHDVFR